MKVEPLTIDRRLTLREQRNRSDMRTPADRRGEQDRTMKQADRDQVIETLARHALEQAACGARAFVHSKTGVEFDLELMTEKVKEKVKEKAGQALLDAQEAFACGMCNCAVVTFGLAMRSAGIEAAKESVKPRQAMPLEAHNAYPSGRWN